MPLHAVVLAGGRARRLGGIDKVMSRIGGEPLLSRAVAAVGTADRVVVVGPAREVLLPRAVRWAREEPPFGGPAAAVAAGFAALAPGPSDEVLVLPADLVHPGAVAAALREAGTVAVDPNGCRQWACVRLRATALHEALTAVDDVAGMPLRHLFGRLDLREVTVSRDDCADLDTPDDAREHLDGH